MEEARFVYGCAALDALDRSPTPEVALLGRSNVGKSSLLNALVGRRPLARVSRTPGRTRELNFFQFGAWRLVDCPGYGFARVSRSVWSEWGPLVTGYLERREQLRLCVLLVDAELAAQPMDLDLFRWLRHRGRPVQLVATKCDRLSGNGRTVALRRLTDDFGQAPLLVSGRTGAGIAELRRAIAAQLV